MLYQLILLTAQKTEAYIMGPFCWQSLKYEFIINRFADQLMENAYVFKIY